MIADDNLIFDCVIEFAIGREAQIPCAHVDGGVSGYPRYGSWTWEDVPIAEAKEQQTQEDGEIEMPTAEAGFGHGFV